jgi:hypothetical protein
MMFLRLAPSFIGCKRFDSTDRTTPLRMISYCPVSETKTSRKPAYTKGKRYEYTGVPQAVGRGPLMFDWISDWMLDC